ncbi:helical backbone metal receptor [Limnohabitans sp. TEGF004]|uniref:ABC transporter substrate-binding protein n=1 Tax=Limnohabitans sp. TEGF004 TaxID=2986281 RepID=UPI002377BA73|nr:helical backbone metal receptor [Limnohabitans sp. TEGF004]BDU55091.1 ABC transporter substrate-binding protein [Limnohabitans sp. TEGF004]
MLKRMLALATLFIMTSTAHAVVLRDDRQIEVTIAKPPQRIVSLLPSLSETVCALGQCDKLVGVDRYSNWPESIAKLPRMGGGIDPNIESVVAAKPDLVLMATSARGAERLTSLGLTVLALEPRSHADVQRVMRIVAQAMDVPLVESDRVWRHIDAAVNAAAQSIPAQAKGQRVYFEVSRAPYGASESSFIGETLQRLGARNILPASLGPFPKINPEFVVRAQPDLIMVGDSNFADMAARPGWQNMRAMRTQRVCHFKSEESDVLVRAGPRMAEAARLMAKCLTGKANDKSKGQP